MRRAPGRAQLTEEIRRILETGFFSFTAHQGERSRERRIPHDSIVHAIGSGRIVEGPEWNDEFENWKVRVDGQTVDGEDLSIILAVDLVAEELTLITAFWKD